MNQPTVRVKVCGITDPAAARICASVGVDWIGLNFHPSSPRYLTPVAAAAIVATLGDGPRPVGLFVDRAPADVASIAREVGLAILQLHGNEPVEDLLALADWPVVRAFRLRDRESIDRMVAYLERASALGCPPHAVLLDAFVPGQLGGTGHAIPLDLLRDLPAHPRIILAGGLNPDNVAGRVAEVRPWMVDVASGVEATPGRQDPDRIRAFVQAARGVSTAAADPSALA